MAAKAELLSIKPQSDGSELITYRTTDFPTIEDGQGGSDKPGLHTAVRVLPLIAPALERARIPANKMDAVAPALYAVINAIEAYTDGELNEDDIIATTEVAAAIREAGRALRS